MIELPFKSAMSELTYRREEVPVTRRVAVSRKAEKDTGSYVTGDVQYRVTYQCCFTMSMTLPDDGEAIMHGHDKAVRVMTEEMYGPLRQELVELLHMMWEDGIAGEPEKKLRELLEVLK